MKCMVCDIEHSIVSLNVHFHKLPICPTRRKAWFDAIGYRRLRVYTGAVICSYHFAPDAYCGKSSSGLCILKDSAIPTIGINLPSTTVPSTAGISQANEVKESVVLDNEFPDLIAYSIQKLENPVDKPVQKEKPIILQSVQLMPPRPIPLEVDLANFKHEVHVESIQDFDETEASTFPSTDTNNLIAYETVEHDSSPDDSIELKHQVKYEPVQDVAMLIGHTTVPNATIKTQSESVKTEPVHLVPLKLINRPCEIKVIQALGQYRPPEVQLAEETSARFSCLSIPNAELLTAEEEKILIAMRPRLKSLGKLKRMKTESNNKMRQIKALNQTIRRQDVKLAYLKKMVGFMSKNKFLTNEDLQYLHKENIASVNSESTDDDEE